MSAHTEGPWHNLLAPHQIVAGKLIVANVSQYKLDDGTMISRDEAYANARLIAAAPDLLAALQHLMRYDFGDSDGAKEARAAIAKATGGEA